MNYIRIQSDLQFKFNDHTGRTQCNIYIVYIYMYINTNNRENKRMVVYFVCGCARVYLYIKYYINCCVCWYDRQILTANITLHDVGV